jgi:hypothetical protein
MYQYENHKNEKGLQRKLEVLYPKRTLLSLVIRHLIAYYLIKQVFTFMIYAGTCVQVYGTFDFYQSPE